jgi:hypothetical protein
MISEVITENEPQNSSLNVNRFFHLPQRSNDGVNASRGGGVVAIYGAE